MSYKVLYTRNDQKKRKTFLDGVCKVTPVTSGHSSGSYNLSVFDDSLGGLVTKKVFTSSTLPSLEEGTELIVNGYIVQLEQVLSSNGGSSSSSSSSSSSNSNNMNNKLKPPPLLNITNTSASNGANRSTSSSTSALKLSENKRSLSPSPGNSNLGENKRFAASNAAEVGSGSDANSSSVNVNAPNLNEQAAKVDPTPWPPSATSLLLRGGNRNSIRPLSNISNKFTIPSSIPTKSTQAGFRLSVSDSRSISAKDMDSRLQHAHSSSSSSAMAKSFLSKSSVHFLESKYNNYSRSVATNLHYYTSLTYCDNFAKALIEEFKILIYSCMDSIEERLLQLVNKNATTTISSQAYKTILIKNNIALGISDVELIKQAKYIPKEEYFKNSKKSSSYAEMESVVEKERDESVKLYLKFPLPAKDIPKSFDALSRGDIWLMWDESEPLFAVDQIWAANPNLNKTVIASAKQLLDSKIKQGFVLPWISGIIFREIFVFRSNWFGLSEKNQVEIDWLSHDFSDRINKSPFNKKETKMFGLRLMNDATMLSSLDILSAGCSNSNGSSNSNSNSNSNSGSNSSTSGSGDDHYLNFLRLSSAPAFINGILTPTRTSSTTLQKSAQPVPSTSLSAYSATKNIQKSKFLVPKSLSSSSVSSLPYSSSSPNSSPQPFPPSFDREIIDSCVSDISLFFGLNKYQASVIQKVGSWFYEPSSSSSSSSTSTSMPMSMSLSTDDFDASSDDEETSNILLVHGVFGSGKSHLLIAVCTFLKYLKLKTASLVSFKCLVSSNTNVAVDRILCGMLNSTCSYRAKSTLMDHDKAQVCDDVLSCIRNISIARVGCPSKIDNELRKKLVVMHENKSSAQKLLSDMLSTDKDPDLMALYNSSKSSDFSDKQRRLVLDSDIAGVTCASSNCSVLKNIDFPVLILDEASQMTEPLSMLPLSCSRCSKIIIVGDPKQLPPTVKSNSSNGGNNNNSSNSSSSHSSCNSNSSSSSNSSSNSSSLTSSNTNTLDLSFTLFDRMKKQGVDCIMLRTQYRCHPAIAGICSELFYEGMLLSGITESYRPALIQLKGNGNGNRSPVAPITTINCQGQVKRVGDSCVNIVEANLIKKLILWIKNQIETNPTDTAQSGNVSIGVICLYKSQAYEIKNMLGMEIIDGKSPSSSNSSDNSNRNSFSSGGGGGGSSSSSSSSSAIQINKAPVPVGSKQPLNFTSTSHTSSSSNNSSKMHSDKGYQNAPSTSVKVSTVDAFQGQELDIVLVSTCKNASTAFLSNPNRINVALSRAKHHVIIVGDIDMLKSDPIWSRVLTKSNIILDPSLDIF